MITCNHPFIKETEIHVFSCFASDVEEFRRGFPKIVPTNMGNKQPFVGYTKKVDSDGDVVYVRYRQQLGCIDLIVYND
jgi:hypothetical protein